MEAPDKIHMPNELLSDEWQRHIEGEDTCYVRKDIVDETVKSAEDHAFFAGQEKFRENLLEWAKEIKRQAEELREEGYGDVFYGAQITLIDEVINKLNSL